jgi:hypothetical protein
VAVAGHRQHPVARGGPVRDEDRPTAHIDEDEQMACGPGTWRRRRERSYRDSSARSTDGSMPTISTAAAVRPHNEPIVLAHNVSQPMAMASPYALPLATAVSRSRSPSSMHLSQRPEWTPRQLIFLTAVRSRRRLAPASTPMSAYRVSGSSFRASGTSDR